MVGHWCGSLVWVTVEVLVTQALWAGGERNAAVVVVGSGGGGGGSGGGSGGGCLTSLQHAIV